ncbi:hypothetical protein GGU10DRAFT_339419 [Lentinula aff. detonsa]|uniref:Uncharacterized protein n=1 Tax=Lentinula aff. detonsa TaxID=2804958 RepID=A0AA38NT98_9AGAR|nr:hypothetical protein GGU10DRAFT_339419 [Lentinula aff. detonsa]
MHSFDTLSHPTTWMKPLLMKFTVSWNLSQLPCISCTRTSTLRPDSQNLHPSLFARRGLRSPEDHPLLLTFIIFVVIVVPLLCLYGIRLYARRRRAEEREDIEASLRHRLELQRNIDRLERDFMIPGSVAEPLPPYFPRPPAYSLNMDGANFNAHIASPDETKLTTPLPVLSRQRSATCFPVLEHSCSGGSQNCTQ